MKVLIIHHFETMWSDGLKMYGTSFEEVGEKLKKHLRRSNYDMVILTRFEDSQLEDAHYELGFDRYIDEVHEYAYGWETSMFDENDKGKTWVDGGQHSEVVYLPDFLFDIKKKNGKVKLCGAFDGQCIEDMEIALKGVGIAYQRLEHLIVG